MSVVADRFVVVPGLAMPFFPARPMPGFALRTPEQAVTQLERDLSEGYFCPPKLNGDRACLAVLEAGIKVQNRHGGWLTQVVKNQAAFLALKPGTCLDGEVMPGGVFYPFECLAWAGESLVNAPTRVRVQAAELICRELEVPWMFAPITSAVVARLRKNLPFCEGYVRKDNGPYSIGYSASAETRGWVKMKW